VNPSAFGRRGLIALGAFFALAGPAAAIPQMDPAHCKGQPQLKPLEPLQVATAKGTFRFQVEIAATPTQQEYGLMCRKSVAPDRGMLFVFPHAAQQAFWMRNTLIPLDIVYIAADGRVVSIVKHAQPLDETPLPSAGPALATLELAAGRADQIGLAPGDRVTHKAFKRG
jgi:uncharacterized membrane protein (UPF0127 family)